MLYDFIYTIYTTGKTIQNQLMFIEIRTVVGELTGRNLSQVKEIFCILIGLVATCVYSDLSNCS